MNEILKKTKLGKKYTIRLREKTTCMEGPEDVRMTLESISFNFAVFRRDNGVVESFTWQELFHKLMV